jgi:hypothetical protein
MYKNDLFHIQQPLFGLCDGLTKCVCVFVCVCVCVSDPGYVRPEAYTTFGPL